MKTIILTQGKIALVDDEDYEILNQYKWHANKIGNTYYALRNYNVYMHREITKPTEGMETDHIDRNGLNNQKSNLRIVTKRGNALNKSVKKTSRFPGVHWINRKKPWRATIRLNGIKTHLDVFETEEEAHEAYISCGAQ